MKTPNRSRAQAIVPFLIATSLFAASVATLTLTLYSGRNVSPKERSLNNIRTLAGAVRAYAVDNDGRLPGWVNNHRLGNPLYAHNTWDQQIRPYVSSDRVYANGGVGGNGIRSYSQPKYHNRVLTYGLNGLLITYPPANFTGNANFSVHAAIPPPRWRLSDFRNPETTVLLAELSTRMPMPGPYGQRPNPTPFTWSGDRSSPQWQRALDGWIDISPRWFIENSGGKPPVNPFQEPYGLNAERGVARDLYDGGGCYAFVDGHVEFLAIKDSVGIGKVVGHTTITPPNCWAAANVHNRWNPGPLLRMEND